MSKGIVNRRDKFLWDNSAKPSITDVEGGGGGGGSSAGVTTYTANHSSNNVYQLDSVEVADEIFNKLNNNEDVQIVLVKDDNKYIARCVGYFQGSGYDDSIYKFSCVVNDTLEGLIAITFELFPVIATLSAEIYKLG